MRSTSGATAPHSTGGAVPAPGGAVPAAGEAVPALSAEVFGIPLEDSRYLVYAPLRRSAFVANRAALDFIEQLRRGVYQPQADPDGSLTGLLRGLEIVDAGPECRPRGAWPAEIQPASVTLLVSTACNLRCTYCYASAGGAAPERMTIETARRGIDFVAANAVSRGLPYMEVGFHGGGEPTQNWTVLTAAFEYARRKAAEQKLELRSSLATNGVLEDEQIEWIVGRLEGLCVSCDGLPAVHDQCRRDASGAGSSPRVLHTLRRFEAAGLAYAIRLTATAAQIPRLAASVDFLWSEFRPETIQIEPVYRLGRGAGEEPAESEEFIAAYREAAARAAARGGRVNFSGARAGTLTNHFCGATQDNFSLSADGNVTACHEAFWEDDPLGAHFFYGRPDAWGGYEFDREVLERLRAQAVENRSHCRDCFARWSCGGDCYYKRLAAGGGAEFNRSPRCHVIRELTKDQILDKIARAGGLVWHEPLEGAAGRPPDREAC